ncbi:MAG: MFS transporter, DHA1 family, bicyclomycin/chloramphenicol resistance protein [Rhodobacteraceae bacterium HLUCCA12]|nr:MAG: MFS transporter, DHA1 family, bicyclomycin/chloramphenicol resistance protein [Rhodobacteraceae bacterium HLUCCA12]
MIGSATPSPCVTLAILCLIATVGLAGSFLYLSALPLMAESFGASEPAAQATLTAFLLGSCLWLALCCRAVDRFEHRRAFTVAGLILVIASLAAAMTSDIRQLVAARLVQGAESVARIVTARTTMPPERAMQSMALLTAVVPLSPAAGLGLVGILGAQLVLPSGIPVLVRNHPPLPEAAILRNSQFRAALLINMTSNSTVVVMMAGTPFIFVEAFGFSPAAYAAVIAGILILFAIVSLVSGQLAARLCAERPLSWSVIPIGTGAALLIAGRLPYPSPTIVVFGLILLIGSMGLMVPNAHILMLEPFPTVAKTAAGLAMLITTAGGALAITLYSVIAAGSVAGFGQLTACCGVSTLLSWVLLPRLIGTNT